MIKQFIFDCGVHPRRLLRPVRMSDSFKQSLTETPSRLMFDECFDMNGEYSEAGSENVEEVIEQQFTASMETEEQMDAISE